MKQWLICLLLVIVSGTLWGEKLAPLPGIHRPFHLTIDDQQFYITEGATVSIFSRKDFILKKKFGRAGQGPGEFSIPPGSMAGLTVHPQADSIVINSPGKVSFFTKNGEFIKEIKSPSGLGGGKYKPIGNQFVGRQYLGGGNQGRKLTINIYDQKLTKIKELYRQSFFQRGRMEFPIATPVFYVSDNKIITPGPQDKFAINIWDAHGKQLAAINREYKRLKVTEEYKEETHEFFRTNPQTRRSYEMIKKQLTFAEEFPAIGIYFVDNQKVYIRTYLKEDEKYEFFIYDFEGKFLKRLFLPMAYQNGGQPCPTEIRDNMLYQVIENIDEEKWELHAVKIL